MRQNYEDRIRRVVRYIHDNPAGDLSLDALAEVAAMSRFHWHRVFQAMTGETCAAAVKRIRLFRAAHWLMSTDDPVDKVAARAGYENPQSFARAFRDVFGLSPAAFRRGGAPMTLSTPKTQNGDTMYTVSLRDQDSIRLAAMPHQGAYLEIGRAFEQLAAVFTSRNLWPQARGMVGVFYDDPSMVPETELRSLAAVSVGADFAKPEDLQDVTLEGGRHAVLLLEGPYTGLRNAYDYLYGDWLSASGADLADAPSYEIYLNSPMDTAPADLRTEICLPLKS